MSDTLIRVENLSLRGRFRPVGLTGRRVGSSLRALSPSCRLYEPEAGA